MAQIDLGSDERGTEWNRLPSASISGRVVGIVRPNPFRTQRTYIGIELSGEYGERYQKIHDAKAEKVRRRWHDDPSRSSDSDYRLTKEELDAAMDGSIAKAITGKRCDRCSQVKNKNQFYRSRLSPDGYSLTCRHCASLAISDTPNSDGKRCGHCEKFKGFDQFYRSHGRAGGYSSWCRTCLSQKRSIPQVTPDVVLDIFKTCCRCKQIKEKRNFYRHRRMRDGLLPACADCERQRKRMLRHGPATPEQTSRTEDEP